MMKPVSIPFNRPFIVGRELQYISEAVHSGHLAGNGDFTKKAQAFLEGRLGAPKVLLTTSCTHALEMCALLCNVGPGDEVILPSYTFVSTANAFVLRGAIPRFVDIRPDTLNMDESLVEAAMTEKTRVICPVHYAGVACEMDAILDVARRYGVRVVEDSAQGMNSTYRGRHLGAIGDLGTLSFHETKNCISGEGGALIVNDPTMIERAEIIWEKGTNRAKFFRGQVDKYTWVDVGSSYLPSELVAAFLMAQFEHADEITRRRLDAWERYWNGLLPLQTSGDLRMPIIPGGVAHNGHMFYIILNSGETRDRLMDFLRARGISSVFHYIPLHSSPMGMTFGGREGQLPITEDLSRRLLRLPLFFDITPEQQGRVIDGVWEFVKGRRGEPGS